MKDLKTLYNLIISFWNFIKSHAAIPANDDEWDELTMAAGEESKKYAGAEQKFVQKLMTAYLEYVHLSAKEGK